MSKLDQINKWQIKKQQDTILTDFIFGTIHLKNNKNDLKININNNESKTSRNLKLLDALKCEELKRTIFENAAMWSQPYGPRMPFDDGGLKQTIGLLVNPIQRFEVARNCRFLG